MEGARVVGLPVDGGDRDLGAARAGSARCCRRARASRRCGGRCPRRRRPLGDQRASTIALDHRLEDPASAPALLVHQREPEVVDRAPRGVLGVAVGEVVRADPRHRLEVRRSAWTSRSPRRRRPSATYLCTRGSRISSRNSCSCSSCRATACVARCAEGVAGRAGSSVAAVSWATSVSTVIVTPRQGGLTSSGLHGSDRVRRDRRARRPGRSTQWRRGSAVCTGP